ncbi:hypothetical protein SAMN04488540_104349 [Ferrimonas sediminum]|uniref:Uncharacterized protein n=1 Tax=Ferrimonas sediminum TaxID=718193 RepID=A0A1G8QNQ9_9GAMM|nr:hypothetical protein [Ferrimonas sediminum]SDJ05750.1 hypothetical protein SAMN04488540_104349 [Ferrimonas sediminum]
MNEFENAPETSVESMGEREHWRSGQLGRQLVAILEDSYEQDAEGDSLHKHRVDVSRG